MALTFRETLLLEDDPCHLLYPKRSLSLIAEYRPCLGWRGSLADVILCLGNGILRANIL
jgi:hypothetical protein